MKDKSLGKELKYRQKFLDSVIGNMSKKIDVWVKNIGNSDLVTLQEANKDLCDRLEKENYICDCTNSGLCTAYRKDKLQKISSFNVDDIVKTLKDAGQAQKDFKWENTLQGRVSIDVYKNLSTDKRFISTNLHADSKGKYTQQVLESILEFVRLKKELKGLDIFINGDFNSGPRETHKKGKKADTKACFGLLTNAGLKSVFESSDYINKLRRDDTTHKTRSHGWLQFQVDKGGDEAFGVSDACFGGQNVEILKKDIHPYFKNGSDHASHRYEAKINKK
ncbi:MAG: hypothetical protein AAF380_02100 [Bacteroidota bacterium]